MLAEDRRELYNLVFTEISKLPKMSNIAPFHRFFLEPLYFPKEDNGNLLIRFLDLEHDDTINNHVLGNISLLNL